MFSSVILQSTFITAQQMQRCHKSTLGALSHAVRWRELLCVCQGACESTGQHRPQHPHIQRGAGGVHTLEERARADRPGEGGTPQKCQGPVEAGVGHGQNREHVRLLTTFWSAGMNFSHIALAMGDSNTVIRPCDPVLFRDLQIQGSLLVTLNIEFSEAMKCIHLKMLLFI